MAKQKLESVISSVNTCLRKLKADSKVSAGEARSSESIDDAAGFDDGLRILEQCAIHPLTWKQKNCI